jgi:hypothetical protein
VKYKRDSYIPVERFFLVTAVKTSNLYRFIRCSDLSSLCCILFFLSTSTFRFPFFFAAILSVASCIRRDPVTRSAVSGEVMGLMFAQRFSGKYSSLALDQYRPTFQIEL